MKYDWLIQSLIATFICYIIKSFKDKFIEYINSPNNSQNTQSKTYNPYSKISVKNLKIYFFASIFLFLFSFTLLLGLFFTNKLTEHPQLKLLLLIALFFGFMLFWGVTEVIFNEITYHRKQNIPKNKSNN